MHKGNLIKLALVLLVLLAITFTAADPRGGRRGGSFGGIFGGWRKYKKPATSTNSRRTTSGSPMHTTLTKSMGGSSGSSSSSSSSIKSATQSKSHASYPKQQPPPNGMGAGVGGHPGSHGYYGGAGAAGGGVGNGGYGGGYVPPGGTYYTNAAAMPPGAIYYAQPPMSSSPGAGNFLFGMMAGHMMSNTLFGHRHYVTHVYQQSPPGENSSGRVIIINNGNVTANATDTMPAATGGAAYLWPTDTDVPLADFNASVTPEEALKPAVPQLPTHPGDPNFGPAPVPTIPAADGNQQPAQPGGIICVPLMFNETDPDKPAETKFVERVVCYPAPPPPPPTPENCITKMTTEIDPNDPTKTIQVPLQDCITTTTTPMPPVAGEIGERWTTERSTDATSLNQEEVPATEDSLRI